MQLYAYDRDKKLIFAKDAFKQMDYYCLECEGSLRRRGGFHRKDHFYHLDALRECRQNGKTHEHLNVQLYILHVLPEGECFLEKRFPKINRIADVVWEDKKLIFEIQCSPISSNEVYERNQDYKKAGYEVVWILHDKRFNQKRLTGAEHFLHSLPHYFTNMNVEGKGEIYDQFSIMDKGLRLNRLKPLPINVREPKFVEQEFKDGKDVGLQLARRRLLKSSLYFSCDLIDRYFNRGDAEDPYIKEAEKFEMVSVGRKNETVFEILKKRFFQYVVKPYQLMLQFFLERACK